MNVSITEDATISRTRSLGGGTIVRVEAIAKVPARLPVLQKTEKRNHRSAFSLISK
jgi:hypothetical protein